MSVFTGVIKRLVQEDEGAVMLEYAIMVAFIAAVCVAAVTLLGGSVRDLFASVRL
jgi:pilus assembly protein Flp/PilA